MEFIYHFYIIEASLALILVYLLLLLVDRKKPAVAHPMQDKLLSKYKSLQSKHNALHTILNKVIVEKINMKSALNELEKENLALKADNEQLLDRYNQAIKALDTNKYVQNIKSQVVDEWDI